MGILSKKMGALVSAGAAAVVFAFPAQAARSANDERADEMFFYLVEQVALGQAKESPGVKDLLKRADVRGITPERRQVLLGQAEDAAVKAFREIFVQEAEVVRDMRIGMEERISEIARDGLPDRGACAEEFSNLISFSNHAAVVANYNLNVRTGNYPGPAIQSHNDLFTVAATINDFRATVSDACKGKLAVN